MTELEPTLRARTHLNLGCGSFPIEGALNVDIRQNIQADYPVDLNNPSNLEELPQGHYERISAFHVLEHLDDVFGTMRVCGALLAPGGALHIRVPHASRGFTHAEHKHGFDINFPSYFNPALPAFYYGTPFELVSMRLDWAVRFDLYQLVIPAWQVTILKGLSAVFSFFANLSPGFCSRLWCYWVGGFDQIEYVFRKPQSEVQGRM